MGGQFTDESINFEAIGIKIDRNDERIKATELPFVFENVCDSEYKLLIPLAASAFVYQEMQKMIYLDPKRFKNATREAWNDYFFSDEPDGYVVGEHMDFNIVIPLSEKVKNEDWKKSKLKNLVCYLMDQMKD